MIHPLLSFASHAVPTAAVLVYMATALRLLCFRPNGSRHRHGLSAAVTIVVAALACRAASILLRADPVSLPELIIAIALWRAAMASRGNLAHLIRSPIDG
ncbi:phage holin family protein [Bordetella sp. H567]|uniref:phage holin family protein n=1 Tax=Bordetella sp. H567 TaxID=1697043 RepID=UPI0009F34C72|nr:phage holin family protein [Bordetella sp. H567]